MRDVFVAATALVSSLGSTLEETWQGLLRGRCGLAEVRHFSTSNLDHHLAALVPDLHANGRTNLVADLTRRVLQSFNNLPPDTYLIWTGIKGNAEFIEKEMDPDILSAPRQYRALIAKVLRTGHEGLELNAACASSTVGLALGAGKIARGECNSVLVCGADVVSRFVFTGFSALKALTRSTCRPFDKNRDGLALGEGAGAVLLMSGPAALQSGYQPLARLSGWGVSNDANHITGPARDGAGLIQAVRQALKMSGLPAGRIEAFCAHGTGTVYNDGMELAAMETLFGQRNFPVFSVKGALGHTLGAAGALETALSVQALQNKIVPGTCGLQKPEEAARGRVSAQTQEFAGNNILTTNSGFGGVNAALILENLTDTAR